MKIVKITDRILTPDKNGEYRIYCQVLIGNAYRYVTLMLKTIEEARTLKEGDNILIGKIGIVYNTKTSVKP